MSSPCCSSSSTSPAELNVHEAVKDYYGKVLKSSADLKTTACCTAGAPPPFIRSIISKIPSPILERYYGCGYPVTCPTPGLTVLDLGSGSGRDCYIMASLVGAEGRVIGVDMTDEQLEVANKYVVEYSKTLGYTKPNLSFKKGYIEFLADAGIANDSVDLIISNCVVNLSPNKKLVLQGAFNALKQGGEMLFSDVYCDRRLPSSIRNDPVLFGECLGGALYEHDFVRLCREVGFMDPRVVEVKPIAVKDNELTHVLGNAKFQSITYRLFKLPDLETLCEDYGQVATYLGTLPNHPHSYTLDDHHVFFTGKRALVCGNTASMLSDSSTLRGHFRVEGDCSVHYGVFACGSTPASKNTSASSCC